MVLFDENAELDLEMFDIYNQYRDQICYLKVDKNLLNLNLDPSSWQELKNIIAIEEQEKKLNLTREWFLKVAPNLYGSDKEFDFTDGLLIKIIASLKAKFN